MTFLAGHHENCRKTGVSFSISQLEKDDATRNIGDYLESHLCHSDLVGRMLWGSLVYVVLVAARKAAREKRNVGRVVCFCAALRLT